ncbi:MAG: ABC transporter ATP-binding protein [Lachnospiraceae bacterium]|nr:ABC transporter ATP-binding protein [Lachnospiraceae bacterium]
MQIEHIKKHYNKKIVLKDVSFQIAEGECVGILGGNGCGKSTLLSILAGVNKPDEGSFIHNETNLLRDRKVRSRFVGYVPQGNPLYDELTAKDNLKLWYSATSMKKELAEGGVLHMLGINEFLNTRVSKMSGGMKKRLSIGCAMAGKPGILLLDEPSAALDLVCKQQIYSYLRTYMQAGGSVIIVTHDIQDLSLCNRYLLLKDGIVMPYAMKSVEQLTKDLV